MNENKTPQLEDGYTRIAHEILEALAKTYLSSYESQIINAIFRKTYGYGKKADRIANSQFVSMTGIHKAHVSRTIKKLLLRQIVTYVGNKIGIQKDHTKWDKSNPKKSEAKVTQIGNTVTQTGNKKLPKQADTIDNIDNSQYINNGAPPKNEEIITTNIQGMNSLQDLLKNRTPSKKITTEYQEKAFRYAKDLNIDLNNTRIREKNLVGRWIKLFKDAHKNAPMSGKIDITKSFLIDYSPFMNKLPDEKILYFFWYFNNQTK